MYHVFIYLILYLPPFSLINGPINFEFKRTEFVLLGQHQNLVCRTKFFVSLSRDNIKVSYLFIAPLRPDPRSPSFDPPPSLSFLFIKSRHLHTVGRFIFVLIVEKGLFCLDSYKERVYKRSLCKYPEDIWTYYKRYLVLIDSSIRTKCEKKN